MKNFLKKIKEARDGDQSAVRLLFYIMVGAIVLSLVWVLFSETVIKEEYKRPETLSIGEPKSSLSDSFGGAMNSATSLFEILELKSSIDSLMTKESLTEADSIKLLEAFQQLEFINQQTNPERNEKN